MDTTTASEIVRLSTQMMEHERRLNTLEIHLEKIDKSVEGIREDFNRHAQEMIGKVAAFTTALKVIGVIGTAVLVSILGLLVRLIQLA